MVRCSHTGYMLTAVALLSLCGPASLAVQYVNADSPTDGPGDSVATAFDAVPADLDAAAPGAEFRPPPAAPRQPGGHAGPVPAPRIDRADVERVRAGIRSPTIIVDWHGTWDYTTIQAALDAAVDGDTIIVLPSAGSPAGAYVENLLFPARAIVLRSINPDDPAIVAATVIDGAWLDTVVTFAPGTPPEAELSGLTITNGDANKGGGLYLEDASPRITNNTITGNWAFRYGGGLYLLYSSATIARNIIAGNIGATEDGGGLYVEESSATITDNTFTGNSADGAGGGLYLWNSSAAIANNTFTGNSAASGGALFLGSSSPTITNNTISGNSATSGGGLTLYSSAATIANNAIAANSASGDYSRGGGLYLWNSSATIANNTITGNSADANGGGLHLDDSSPAITNNMITSNSATVCGGGLYLTYSSPTIANNTITGNWSANEGGGLYLYYSCDPTIANSIVAFNSSGVYRTSSSFTPTLRYNCVYGNEAYDYVGIDDPTGTDGNISVDSLVADPAYGNMHIQSGSPCVDAGNNADAVGDEDIDGQPRIQPGGGTVDIGADESDGTLWAPGPYVIVRVAPDGNDSNDGSTWTLAKQTVQAGIDAAAALGGEVWVAGGTYFERVALHPYAYVYGGFAGDEAERDERDWVANATILDGQQAGSVVSVRAGHRVSTIDGFTITNGAAVEGGGLYVRSSDPTIANNTIMVNSASQDGGGLYVRSCSPTIANNTITANSASEDGGGLHLYRSSPEITNNTVSGNGAYGGGGLYVSPSCSPRIANNTITNNYAKGGGGLDLSSSSPTIANTIVAFNSSGIYRYGGTPILRFNCVYGNKAYDYSGITDPTGTDGNISVDPLLADPAYGSVHLQPGSPCVDAGNNGDAVGDEDIDGQSRIQPGGGTVDIGADESDGTVWDPGPYVIVRVAPDGDDNHDGSTWGLAKQTVQAGSDTAASLGGEVWVAAGTYFERIMLHPYAFVYGGFAGDEAERDERDWVVHTTILDGQQAGSVVTVLAGHRVSTIDGFTVTHGDAEDGGGLYVESCSPTIDNNTIVGNSGQGLYLYASAPTITNNTIAHNSGQGLYLYASSPTITNNTIAGNVGGGLYLRSYSSPTIANNTIMGNSGSGGGGLHLEDSSPTITHNTIRGNSASQGGGLYLDVSFPTIANNTITGNSGGQGGGLYLYSSSPTITNNTITGNWTGFYGGGLYLHSSSPTITSTVIAFNSAGIYLYSGTPIMRHNCVYGNDAYDYSGITDPTGTNGNISGDPLLADLVYGNVHIQPGSPCVDAGNNADAVGDEDMDGQPRIQPGGGTVDIGADESDGTEWAPGPYVIVRVAPDGDDDHDGLTWALAKLTVQAGIDTAGSLGGEVWVAGGTYYERITLLPYAYAYGGFTAEETDRQERDYSANLTVLDGQQTGTVVTARAGHRVSTIDGFTITNGNGTLGGGLYVRSCSPTIANNTIVGNRSAFDGGGLYLSSSSSTITNSIITGNSADRDCGGLFLNSSSATVANNTIAGNSASGEGGGLYLRDSSPAIANIILAFNSSGIYRSNASYTPTLRYNCVYGNTAYDYSGLTDPTGTDGNIGADPFFVDPDGPDDDPDTWADNDLRLASGSPCIDAGDSAAVPADAADLDGDGDTDERMPYDLDGLPRFVDDPDTPDTGLADPPDYPQVVDMGAYEFQPSLPACTCGDIDGSGGVVGLGDFATFAACYGCAAPNPPHCTDADLACSDLDGSGTVDLTDFATFAVLFGAPATGSPPNCTP